jgi:hypothetical protein
VWRDVPARRIVTLVEGKGDAATKVSRD